MRRAVLISILIVTALIGYLVWQKNRAIPFVVSGFIEADEVRVGSRVGGRIAEIHVEEGTRVTTGQPLFRIEPFDLMEQLAQAKAQQAGRAADHALLVAGFRVEETQQARARRDALKATLEMLISGPRPQEIAIAREQLKIAQANLDMAQSEYDRVQRLRTEAQAAQKEFDEAVRALKASKAEVVRAEQQLGLLVEGTRQEEIAQARAALAEAEERVKLQEQGYRKEDITRAVAELDAASARVAAIEKQMQELMVTSPCDCVVEAIDLQPGDLVAPNAPSLSLLDLSKMWVRSYVPESRLADVKLDQRVPIRIESHPQRLFNGRVTYIAREAEFTPKNVQTPEERSKQVFRIKVTIEEGRERLRVGMSADLLLDRKIEP